MEEEKLHEPIIQDEINDIEEKAKEAKEKEIALEEDQIVDNNNNDDNLEVMTEDISNAKIISPSKMVLRRFFRSKLSLVGLIIIIALFAFSYLGPVILKLLGQGHLNLIKAWGETETDYSGVTEIIQKSFDYKVGDKTYTAYDVYEYLNPLNKCSGISATHWLGTDENGFDIFTRLMYGGRISLAIGFIVVFMEMFIGVIMGGLAGYFGKWVDQVIMRLVDIFNCIPTLPILLISSAVLDSLGISGSNRIYYLMFIITIFGWSGTARMVRGQILYLREQEYMVASEVMGYPTSKKIFGQLIPNVLPQLIVSATLGLGSVILYESTLSYLGLGVQQPYAAWGTMISAANNIIYLENYPLLWVPAGICVVLAVLGFNFIGDGLRDAFDPKGKR